MEAGDVGTVKDLFDVLVTGRKYPLGVTYGRARAFFSPQVLFVQHLQNTALAHGPLAIRIPGLVDLGQRGV